jgi:hypothetical protein
LGGSVLRQASTDYHTKGAAEHLSMSRTNFRAAHLQVLPSSVPRLLKRTYTSGQGPYLLILAPTRRQISAESVYLLSLLANLLFQHCDAPRLLLNLVKQHRVDEVIPNRLRCTAIVVRHKARVYLCDLFGDETILLKSGRIDTFFVAKANRPQRHQAVTLGAHIRYILFETGR